MITRGHLEDKRRRGTGSWNFYLHLMPVNLSLRNRNIGLNPVTVIIRGDLRLLIIAGHQSLNMFESLVKQLFSLFEKKINSIWKSHLEH